MPLFTFNLGILVILSGTMWGILRWFDLSRGTNSVVETMWKFVEEFRALLLFGLRKVANDFKDALGEFNVIQVLFLPMIFLGAELRVESDESSLTGLLQQLKRKLVAIWR